jgi:hypothetical protein
MYHWCHKMISCGVTFYFKLLKLIVWDGYNMPELLLGSLMRLTTPLFYG